MFNEDIINLTQQTQKGIHVLCRRTRQFFLIVIVNNVFHEILYFLSFFFFVFFWFLGFLIHCMLF